MSEYGTMEAPNHSMLARRNRCLREYYYGDVMGFRLRGVESVRLVVGSAIHAALEVLHMKGWEASEEARAEMYKHLAKLGQPLVGEFEWLTWEHLEWVLKQYMVHYDGNDPQFKAVMSESRLVVATGVGELSVTPDLIVFNELTDEYAVVDHKSTFGNLGKPLEWRVLRGHQLRMYMIAMREHTQLPITRVICNAIHLGPKLTKKGAPRNIQRFMRYSREVFESELDETKAWVIATQERMMRDREMYDEMGESGYPQSVSTACMWCDYGKLCEVPPSRRSGVVSMLYELKGVNDAKKE